MPAPVLDGVVGDVEQRLAQQLAVALLLVPSVLLIVAAAIIAYSGSLLPGF